jgi:hypothetical protein
VDPSLVQRWPRQARHAVHCLLRAARRVRTLPDGDARRARGVALAARAALAAVAIRPLQVEWTGHGGALLGVPFAVDPADLATLAAMRAAGCDHWTLARDLTPRSVERWIHWLARPAPKQAPELAGVLCHALAPGEPAPLLWWGLPEPDPRCQSIGDRLRAELDGPITGAG